MRVTEEGGSNSEALAHAERESSDALLRDRLEARHRDHFVDACFADAVSSSHREKVVVGSASGVNCFSVEQSPHFVHRVAVLGILLAVDGHRSRIGAVKADDGAHGR